MYTLDYIVTRVFDTDGRPVDLDINDFKIIPQPGWYESIEEAEQERIRLSAIAKDGFYRIVPMETNGEF
jgi:hypothetical protein